MNNKMTKKQISQEIEIKAAEISRLLDVSMVTKEACKDLKCISIIEKHQEQLTKIKEENYKNYRNLGWKHFDRTFNKPNLEYILTKITKHIEIVNNCLDNIFAELNKIVEKLKNTEESINLVFSEISNGNFAHATMKLNFYYLVQNLNHMRTLKEVRNVEGYEQIEKKHYQYTYKYRGFSPGCQPINGFVEHQKIEMFEYGVIIYDRQLTNKEIENYELIALN